MRDLKFACSHCEQHIKCGDDMAGKLIACPACGREVLVPTLDAEHHLHLSTGKIPVPTHAHGAPRSADPLPPLELPPAKPEFSKYAIASIALSAGSVVLTIFGCIPGIIFGYLAKAELRENPRLQGAELARAGIIVGYCFLVLFTIIGIGWLVLKMGRGD